MAEVNYKPKPGDLVRMDLNVLQNELALILDNGFYLVLKCSRSPEQENSTYKYGPRTAKVEKIGEITQLERLVYGVTI